MAAAIIQVARNVSSVQIVMTLVTRRACRDPVMNLF